MHGGSMKQDEWHWYALMGVILVTLSAVLYFLHYVIFQDTHFIYIYTLLDIAFIPINVLVVTIIVRQLLANRERKMLLEKLNMLIGTFFSEIGTSLLAYISDYDPELDAIRGELAVTNEWTDATFTNASIALRRHDYSVTITESALQELKRRLLDKRDFLARLLENPNLLEHESFTQLLRAVFHLTEELASRKTLIGLPQSDMNHLANDIQRVYAALANEWLNYMQYLQRSYPFLFSLAMRTNPFDEEASPIVS